MALGGPIIGMRMSTFLLFLLLHIYLGHLGIEQLSAGLIGFTMFRGTAISIMISLTAGLSTIGGQAFGAKEYRLVGLLFQRSLAFCILFSLVMSGLYTQSEWLLSHLGQKPQLAHNAGRFMFLLSPSVVLLAPLLCLQYYWIAQKVTTLSMVAGALSVMIAPVIFWYFMFSKAWDIDGGAVALNVIFAVRVAMLAGWSAAINWRKSLVGAVDIAWHGWSLEAFKQWGELLKIAMFTMFMMSVKGWLFDYYTLLAGTLPQPEESVSILGITLYIFNISMVTARSLNAGLAFSVAHEIGAGNATQAKYTMQAAFCMILGIALIYNALVLACSSVIGYIWTSDTTVVSSLPTVLLLSCTTSIGQAMGHVFAGVLAGVRRQKEGSRIVLSLYTLIGIPGPWLFSFRLGWGVMGLWTTRLIVVILEDILLGLMVLRLDWEEEVERALEVVQRQKRDSQPDLPVLLGEAHPDGGGVVLSDDDKEHLPVAGSEGTSGSME